MVDRLRSRIGAAVSLALALATASPRAHAQDTLFAHLPIARTLTRLTSADASVRREAAARLALTGTHDAIAVPLRTAIEHEAVPEALAAMIHALARRAEESDLAALELAWDRAAAPERRAILGALDALDGDTARMLLRHHLASEGTSARACDALVRTEARLAWLVSTLEDAAARDRVVSCLASAEPSETRDSALLRAGLDLEPTRATEVLGALARSDTPRAEAIALAETALARTDATLSPPALALLARHAPDRLPVERWRTWLGGDDDREASAMRALLVLAPAEADDALEALRGRDGRAARRGLAVLLDRDDLTDHARIALFVAVPETRAAALDALVERHASAVLAALPAASDVDLALALTSPLGAARDALLARAPSVLLRALVHDADEGTCATAPALEAATCLVIVGPASVAAQRLETERDPAIVGWLALAAGGAAPSTSAMRALLENEATRAAVLSLVPVAMAHAAPADRRALESRVVRAAADDDEVVRAEAILALGALGHAAHRARVLAALEDDSAQVRLAAARSLARVGIADDDVRVIGRTHVETDDRVLAALRHEPLAMADAPLHVRVVDHDPGLAGGARVTILLADGRSLRLAPVHGEVIVRGVPDGTAIVTLASRH